MFLPLKAVVGALGGRGGSSLSLQSTVTAVMLLEVATMSRVLAIPARKHLSVPIDHTVVLCTSLENETAVHCFAEGGKGYLGLWGIFNRYPQWTVQTDERPLAGSISPACARLATFHSGRFPGCVRIWDVHDGRLVAELGLGTPFTPPLPISHSTRKTDFTSTATPTALLTMSPLYCNQAPPLTQSSVVGGFHTEVL